MFSCVTNPAIVFPKSLWNLLISVEWCAEAVAGVWDVMGQKIPKNSWVGCKSWENTDKIHLTFQILRFKDVCSYPP